MANFSNFTQNGAYNAIDDRFSQGALLARDATGKVAPGILPGAATDGRVSAQATPNLTVSVAPFTAVVSDGARGAYVGGIDVTTTFNVLAPETTNNRVDVLAWRPLESVNVDSLGASTLGAVTLADGTSATKQIKNGEVYWVKGTPSSSTTPTVPNTPAGAVALARVYVGGGVTAITAANITDVRSWTGLLGGVVTMPAVAGMSTSLPRGTLVYDAASDRTYTVGASGVLASRENRQVVLVDTQSKTVTGTGGDAAAITYNLTPTYSQPIGQKVLFEFVATFTNAQFTSGNQGRAAVEISSDNGSTWSAFADTGSSPGIPGYGLKTQGIASAVQPTTTGGQTLRFRVKYMAWGPASQAVTRIDQVMIKATPLSE